MIALFSSFKRNEGTFFRNSGLLKEPVSFTKRYKVENQQLFCSLPDSSRKETTNHSSRKIIIYAIIGIIAVAAVYTSTLARSSHEVNDLQTNSQQQDQEVVQQRFEQQFCGTGNEPNYSDYITEIALPKECEMPLGIAIDDERVWYISTKHGILGSYNSATETFDQYEIPLWPTRTLPFASVPSWLMSWTVKVDESGENIWFTDQNNTIWRFNQPTKGFEMFNVPAKYPSVFDFDSSGNLYFIGINSQSLFFGNVSLMNNATSDGFREISLPLDGFSSISSDLVTSGGLIVDNERNDVWVSLLAFQQNRGQLFQYDIETDRVVRIVDLPPDLGAPVGMDLDDAGSVWVADHGTSTFFKYDTILNKTERFVTSIASPRIYGGVTPETAYTLPYWIDKADDGSLWFNQHTGNKMARFNPAELSLVEYWIPSQNRAWTLCAEGAESCGIANAMQFATGPDNHIWFTEWTENKIAKLDASKQIPIAISTPNEVAVARGESTEIKVRVNASNDFSGEMMAAGTFVPNATLGNSTGIFSEESVSILSGAAKDISYTFTAADDLEHGEYMIMLGAGNDDISYMKAVKINIV
jgi:virginiamycin B lyase